MILFDKPSPKIAVFRALQLGDMLCAVPALRALRASYPTAEITLLGLPWASSFVKRFKHYIDRFIHFPGYPGLPEQAYSADKWSEFVHTMHQEQFDLIVQMQGNGTIVNEMLQTLGSTYVAGFHCDSCYMDSPLFIEYPNQGSEIIRHLALMEHIGAKKLQEQLEYPIEEHEQEELNQLALPLQRGTYVCVHPGSRGSWRQWPVQHFASLADYVGEQGFTIVLTGTKEEAPITQAVKEYMNHPAIDLTGQTSLGAIAALIRDAGLLISNCTGVSHIAAAVQTPSIVISMDGEPERWGPLNKILHKTIDWTKNQDYDHVFWQTEELLSTYAKGLSTR